MEQAQIRTIIRTYQRPLAASAKPVVFLTILQRLNNKDTEAVADCIDTYGNLIWAFARQHMRSWQEADLLAEEIFKDIWSYAEEQGGSVLLNEPTVIKKIAVSRLNKHVCESVGKF